MILCILMHQTRNERKKFDESLKFDIVGQKMEVPSFTPKPENL